MGRDPTTAEFLSYLARTGVISDTDLNLLAAETTPPLTPEQIASASAELVRKGKLTEYQARILMEGESQPLIFADYIVLDRIGRGGVGQVYQGMHPRMKRLVAIKVLPHAAANSEEMLARFRREVEVSASLTHPNIVAAYDAGEDDAGRPFLVMEFVQGPDLATFVRRLGPLPVERALDFVIQAAKGLAYAHARGVYHRDVKPGNLLVDPAGHVKLLDLGLARYSSPEHLDPATVGELTRFGDIMGTPDYIAPEQAVDSRTADHRADIYGLGCTLYFLLTGRPVYEGDTAMKKILAHRDQPIPSVRRHRREVPPELDTTIRRMIAKSPEDRFQSMQQVIDALEGLAIPLFSTDATTRVGMLSPVQDTDADILMLDITTEESFPQSTQLKSLDALVGACGAVTGFISIADEQEVFRRGAELGLNHQRIEGALNLACRTGGRTRESILSEKMQILLKQVVDSAGSVSQKSFDFVVAFAARRKMPRARAEEVCATVILNHRWPARERILDRWFTRRCKQYGLH